MTFVEPKDAEKVYTDESVQVFIIFIIDKDPKNRFLRLLFPTKGKTTNKPTSPLPPIIANIWSRIKFDQQITIVCQKALIYTFHTGFWLQNNLCGFKTQEKKIER